MNEAKVIWILTAAGLLAANLQELLELEGYCCVIYKNIREIGTALPHEPPEALVLDELNNKGCYDELLRMLIGKQKPKLIVLYDDNEKVDFALAHSCVGLPNDIGAVAGLM